MARAGRRSRAGVSCQWPQQQPDLAGVSLAESVTRGSGLAWPCASDLPPQHPVDFSAALCFIIGSIMFFSEAWMSPATWFFTVGSFLFAMKPTLRLWREIKLYRMGKTDTLADRWG